MTTVQPTRLDSKVSLLGEQVARKLSRRKFLAKGTQLAALTVASTALVQFTNMPTAAASTCGCSPPHQRFCTGCQDTLQVTCPAGCSKCTTADGCPGASGCSYPSGYWVGCSGMGVCHNGYNICYDCKCPGCSNTCGCGSSCRCCNCCSAEDLRREQARYDALAQAGL